MQLREFELWFITGSQHLYGDETLKNVAVHAHEIASNLDNHSSFPVRVVDKGVVTTPDDITQVMKDVNQSDQCIGVIFMDAYLFTS